MSTCCNRNRPRGRGLRKKLHFSPEDEADHGLVPESSWHPFSRTPRSWPRRLTFCCFGLVASTEAGSVNSQPSWFHKKTLLPGVFELLVCDKIDPVIFTYAHHQKGVLLVFL